MIGTPFVSNNERDQRKVNRINKKPWEQEVRDEKGRKRFHGAFTGGFSAGYYNSVGSKEGWQPKKFSHNNSQNVMDYMDEEDIVNQAGTHTIGNKDDTFTNTYTSEMIQSNTVNQSKNKIDFGSSILDELNFIPKMNQMQQTLMSNAGYSKELIESNINNQSIKKQSFKFKDNYEGIGYIKGNECNYKTTSNTDRNSGDSYSISNTNIMKMNQFEENESLGFYNERDISDYNFEEIDVYERNAGQNKRGRFGASGPRGHYHNDNNQYEQVPKFLKSKHHLHLGLDENEFKMPKVPDDFDPMDISFATSNNQKNNNDEKIGSKCFDMEKRKQLLKLDLDSKESLSTKFESHSNIINKKSKGVNEIDSFNQIENVFNFKLDIPFKDDLSKKSRFARFLAEKDGLKSNDNLKIDHDEQLEFEKLYQTNLFIQSQSKQLLLMSNKSINITNTKSDEVIVKKEKWIPNPALCRKCKIKNPYEKDISSSSHSHTNNIYNSIQMKCLKESGQLSNNHRKLKEDEALQMQNNERNTKLLIEAEPDINLFESIFN